MNDSVGLLDPVESDILRVYFGLRTTAASRDSLLQPLEEPASRVDDADDAARDRRGVRIRRDLRSPDFPGDAPLANAVARICLDAIQSRLPSSIGVTSRGELVGERTPEPARPTLVVALPRLLLAIDWADSRPGFSWPETYHATYLPQFRRHVITASLDCAETWGATDLAIGVVHAQQDFLRGCGRVICSWWRHQRTLGDQPPWATVLDTGLVGLDTAHAWRVRTWGTELCAECV